MEAVKLPSGFDREVRKRIAKERVTKERGHSCPRQLRSAEHREIPLHSKRKMGTTEDTENTEKERNLKGNTNLANLTKGFT